MAACVREDISQIDMQRTEYEDRNFKKCARLCFGPLGL